MRQHAGLIAIIAAVAVVTIAIAAGSRESGEPEGTPRRATRAAEEAPVAMGDIAVARLRADALAHRLAETPDDPALKLELADASVTGERYRKAAALYAELVDDETYGPVAYVRLALVRHRQGRRQQALQALQSAVVRWPDMQEAHYQLAIVAFAHQDLPLALQEWERAASLDPGTQLGRAAAQFVALLTQDDDGASPSP
jgi:tetratricopeptide (TPR) repeat protein